ncbi:hypothetical protein BC567DRAFT_264889 [Phyllosticta citribraziliensis]
MAAPTIPPRPARSTPQQQNPNANANGNGSTAMPSIPPRPKRSTERSISPNRDNFARSPLNDPSFINGSSTNHSKRPSASDLPARPPSVTLPTIGQEGSEYASFDTPPIDENAPQQTRDAEGLKLYAPTASLPQSTNRSRIAGVTRADSAQVAAAGLGKKPSEPDLFPGGHSRGHSRSGSSTGRSSRPTSLYQQDEEHGIPEIGLQVPMYPNAGDVQAPTPSLHSNAPSTGVGYFNNGGSSSAKLHGRPFAGPPGSYGMHGHGLKPTDDLERKWYATHPDDAAREAQGAYGPAIQENRREWTLSSEQLNKLVQESANKGVGMGASPAVTATPGEEIGYMASEEYASRMTSPRPQSVPPKERTRSSQTHAESPLRMTKMVAEQALDGGDDGSAIEHDDEGNVIHIDPPAHPRSEMHGPGIDYDELGPEGGNGEEHGGFITEDGRGTPVLASDELKRHQTPGGEYQQPAVPAELEHERRISQEGGEYHRRSGSRSTSRPTSVSRWRSQGDAEDRSNTPLDGVKEYEPLFPEEEDEKPVEKPLTAADKLKRPELARHHFPSQDVWEDTPSSLQLQAEVQTPEVPSQPASGTASLESSQVFEKPEREQQRKADAAPKDQPQQQSFFIPDQAKRLAHLNKDVLADMPSRPGMQQRFPSRDIWEDTPDELKLVTTVNAPQEQESPSEPKSAVSDAPPKPQIPARPARAKPGESPVEKKAAPILPDRPKPQIPVRPARPAHKPSDEAVPLSKVSSASSNNTATADDAAAAAAPPVTKPKPPVPSRPGGSKIAALKAGFLSNLESRLQLGPQGPKKEEKEDEVKEKAPLADARKGRAKGPARRRPGAGAGAAASAPAESTQKPVALSFAKAITVFAIDEDGALDVPELSAARAGEEKDGSAEAKEIATQVPRDPQPAPGDVDGETKPVVDVKPSDEGADDAKPAEPATREEQDETRPAATTAAPQSSTQAESETAAGDDEPVEQSPLLAKQPTNATASSTSDSTTQTGQQDIVVPPAAAAAAAPAGAESEGDKATQTTTEKITAYLGGRAQEDGSVVVREVLAGEGKGESRAVGEGEGEDGGEGDGEAGRDVLLREEFVGGVGEGGVVGEARVQRTGHGM